MRSSGTSFGNKSLDKSRQLPLQDHTIIEFALPYRQNPKAPSPQFGFCALVSRSIRKHFFPPKSNVFLGKTAAPANMRMPETAMDKYAPPLTDVGDVRTAGQTRRTNPKANSQAVQQLANRQLRRGVPDADASHTRRDLQRRSRGVRVSH